MNRFYTAAQWLSHRLTCQSPHSVHSPALYEFYTEVIRNDNLFPEAERIEIQRKAFIQNTDEIAWSELGAGPVPNNGKRRISDLALKSLTPEKWCRLLYRLTNYLQAKSIVELGTCLGISTLYLSVRKDSLVTTIEGNSALIPLVESAFQHAGRNNIRILSGNIDDKLDLVLESVSEADLVFLDANHRYDPTIAYAKKIWGHLRPGGILIADDIYRSESMTAAWEKIRRFESCACTIDLFRWGIAVRGPSELHGYHKWTIS